MSEWKDHIEEIASDPDAGAEAVKILAELYQNDIFKESMTVDVLVRIENLLNIE